MMKVTPALKKRISQDWQGCFPGLKIWKPIRLLRRVGPLLIGITLALGSSQYGYQAYTRQASSRATVKVDSLNVHAEMSATSKVMKSLKMGDIVTIGLEIVGTNGNWCEVTEPGKMKSSGYVQCKFLEREQSSQQPVWHSESNADPSSRPPKGPPSDAQECAITEKKIRAIVEASEAAIKKRDVDGACAFMAKNIVIRISVEGGPKFVLNLEQYKARLRQALSIAERYDYKYENLRITIAPDCKSAKVTDQVYEQLHLAGSVTRTVSSETAIFTVREGKIVISSIEAVTRPNRG